MPIRESFRDIAGFELLPRQTNYIGDRVERKDSLFTLLAVCYFSDPQRFKKIQGKITGWLRKEQSETTCALAGYVYYIAEDFKKAKKILLKAVSLNPDNLDTWIDLAFALRHNGEYEVSDGIFFNYSYVAYYYKYLKLRGANFSEIKKLVSEIVNRTKEANAVI
jgi:tetratricopeptide (TPR) repeat protein